MILIGVAIGLLASIAAAQILRRTVEGMQPAEITTFATMTAITIRHRSPGQLHPRPPRHPHRPVETLRQD